MSMSITTPQEKTSRRRVHFSLPEAKLTLTSDKRTLHGTTKYLNGTLINITSTIHLAHELGKSDEKNEINRVFKSSLKSNGNSISFKENSQFKKSLNIHRLTSAKDYQGRNSIPTTTLVAGRRRTNKTITRKSFNTLPIIERKSSSLEDFDGDSLEEESAHDTKSKTSNLTRYKSSDDLRDFNNFKTKSIILKLPEAQKEFNSAQKKPQTLNSLQVPSGTSKIYKKNHFINLFVFHFLAPSFQNCETNSKLKSDVVSSENTNDRLDVTQIGSDGNLEQFFEFVEKWRTNRLAGNKKIDDIFRNSSSKSFNKNSCKALTK